MAGEVILSLAVGKPSDAESSVPYTIMPFSADVQGIFMTAGAQVITAVPEEVDITSLPGCTKMPIGGLTPEEIEGIESAAEKDKLGIWKVCYLLLLWLSECLIDYPNSASCWQALTVDV